MVGLGLYARACALSLPLALAALVGTACAGPPFITDDPEPTDQGHWEIYNYAQGQHTPGDTSGEAGIDLNYGAARDLQLTAVLPAQFSGPEGGDWGMGDIELAAKYRVAHQNGPLGVDLAIFPRVFVPSAYDRGPDRHANLLLPIWAQKDFGKWSVFGGGGYQINPGPNGRNFWISGVTVTRQVTERLMLGAELYHQTATTPGGKDFTTLNPGGQVQFAKHWSLLFSAGPGVQNPREEGQYVFYTALKADY